MATAGIDGNDQVERGDQRRRIGKILDARHRVAEAVLPAELSDLAGGGSHLQADEGNTGQPEDVVELR